MAVCSAPSRRVSHPAPADDDPIGSMTLAVLVLFCALPGAVALLAGAVFWLGPALGLWVGR